MRTVKMFRTWTESATHRRQTGVSTGSARPPVGRKCDWGAIHHPPKSRDWDCGLPHHETTRRWSPGSRRLSQGACKEVDRKCNSRRIRSGRWSRIRLRPGVADRVWSADRVRRYFWRGHRIALVQPLVWVALVLWVMTFHGYRLRYPS
jgi:hypothetical protein